MSDLRKFIEAVNEEEGWRGKDCWERDEDGLREILHRRIFNRWGFDCGCLFDGEWNAINAAFDPETPEEPHAWNPSNRLRQAENAFLAIMGLAGLTQEEGRRSFWAAEQLATVNTTEDIYFMPPRVRRWLMPHGIRYLAELANDS